MNFLALEEIENLKAAKTLTRMYRANYNMTDPTVHLATRPRRNSRGSFLLPSRALRNQKTAANLW